MKNTDYHFSNPYIKESIFYVNDGFISEQPDTLSVKASVSAYTSYTDEQEENCAIGGLTIQVGTRDNNTPFFAKITMEANFSWENKTINDIKNFFKVNAPTLLAGYARPIIVFLTANSPYPPFHLEFINFAE